MKIVFVSLLNKVVSTQDEGDWQEKHGDDGRYDDEGGSHTQQADDPTTENLKKKADC